jgi:hypothetical protein
MHEYASGQHRFFDDLVNWLVAMASFAVAAWEYSGGSGRFRADEPMNLAGKLIDFDLLLRPSSLIDAVVADQRPNRIQLEEFPRLHFPDRAPRTEPRRILGTIIQAAFVHYYETLVESIRATHGRSTSAWPAVLNFGRVIRNGFTHGGRIAFDNPRAAPVSWRGLTYGPGDNGRPILYADLMPADIILLMEEMDLAL